VGCLEGIGDAARALDFPIVSGNVSLYNETQGRGILPTPSIGGVGKIDDVSKAASLSFKAAGEEILLIGETQGWLGQSMYLWQICGREEGAPPPVDLSAERRNGDFVRGLIDAGRVDAVHDLSDGGLAVALAEMAIAGKVGAKLTCDLGENPHAMLFGEDQGRYLLSASADQAQTILADAKAKGVPVAIVGTTGGDALELPGEKPVAISALDGAHEGWLPAYMAGQG
jgi:phosphoribosylformylglycinamidine synthase